MASDITFTYKAQNVAFKYPFDNAPIVTIYWKTDNGEVISPKVEPIVTKEGFTIPSFSHTFSNASDVYKSFDWVAVAHTSTNRLTINTTPEDANITVGFSNGVVTFTINPTPSDAVVTLTADGYTQVGNSIEVEPGTLVEYSVSKEGYTTISNSVVVNEDTILGVELEEAGVNVTVNIDWHAASADITMYVNGESYYEYPQVYTGSTTHAHKVPMGSTVSFHTNSNKGLSCSSVSKVSGDTTTTSTGLSTQIGNAYIVNGDCVFEIWSSIEPS